MIASVYNLQIRVLIEKNLSQNKRKVKEVVEKALKSIGSDIKVVDIKD